MNICIHPIFIFFIPPLYSIFSCRCLFICFTPSYFLFACYYSFQDIFRKDFKFPLFLYRYFYCLRFIWVNENTHHSFDLYLFYSIFHWWCLLICFCPYSFPIFHLHAIATIHFRIYRKDFSFPVFLDLPLFYSRLPFISVCFKQFSNI